MSLSGALSNALSGLTSSSRLADVAASNISNAMTEGYGVRQAVLAPRSAGDEGGVQVLGITRMVDKILISDRRKLEAELAYASTGETFFTRMQRAVGLPDEAGSLSDRIAQLEASLAEATRAPESAPQLLAVTSNLASVAEHLNTLGRAVQTERMRADSDIGTQVESLNSALQQIEKLNKSIQRHVVLDHDVSAMLDQRQALVDQVGKIVPVTEIDRPNGAIALMTRGGQFLLDGKAVAVSFSETATITAHMTLSGGTLSGLEIDGRAVDTGSSSSAIAGGTLQGLFDVRDDSSVELQAKLDGFARDLIERFEDPSVDVTLAATAPGLLTDGGAKFNSADETGLAQRIEMNALVDPAQGGQVWRLRDGLGAASQGPEGRSALLIRLSGALTDQAIPSSGAFSGTARTAATLAADLNSHIGSSLELAEQVLVFSQVQYDSLKQLELAGGVDTDAEMQRLLIIEQAYAANARVVETIDEMLDWLMRI
ncbi:flagellar hook-associated protein FlgK [Poseidonocella sp. HB161398]|uniref:flagellar hook-associated protein FlgK n=1 Tax=Poseidonocella sp. HB161398 TaxID=2320855 RepID=UPI001109DC88|nr:flagellar hook-associated protein FlgK [Poseidonocella sp. HB161398]